MLYFFPSRYYIFFIIKKNKELLIQYDVVTGYWKSTLSTCEELNSIFYFLYTSDDMHVIEGRHYRTTQGAVGVNESLQVSKLVYFFSSESSKHQLIIS